jgi:catechol 2,3-dioxygenase-like lactoylglutathione lyase family enzyme
MPIRITKLLHAGVRVGPGDDNVKKALDFYEGLLGLERDQYRPHVPGVPGHWMNLNEGDRSQQIHLFGAEGVSPMGRSAKEDPTRHHIAYAVADLAEAERELEARGISYWIYDSLVGDASKQVFFEDPFGNMIELQQQGRAHDAPVR